MACFADINVSQGSVATYARRGGIFNIHLTTHLPRNLPVKKKFLNRFRFDRITVMSLWSHFFAHPVKDGGENQLALTWNEITSLSPNVYATVR